MFIDETVLEVHAGDGGRGCVSFRREYREPRGGPNGGDGGEGGSVYLLAEVNLRTLAWLRYRRIHRADRGEDGRGKNQHGARGKNCELKVPTGTLVYDADTDDVLADLVEDGQRVLLGRGGRGGRGNARFATPSRQAPRFAQPGEPGESRRLRLELKLLADVGLVGRPNAGKSSLLTQLTRARPRVASYPFTTLEPHLGVASVDEMTEFVLADIPGLIEGAHSGAGLGTRFLKHVERCRLLVHVVDLYDTEVPPRESFEMVRTELSSYAEDLSNKPFLVALNKADLYPEQAPECRQFMKMFQDLGHEVLLVSAATGQGSDDLLAAISVRLGLRAPSAASG